MSKEQIEGVMLGRGWLAQQPRSVQREVLDRGTSLQFEPGDAVYRIDDPCGGIFGLINGALGISIAPPNGSMRLVQFGIPGAWTGEGPFFTGEPRRAELRAITRCALFHLPLDEMRQMAASDPESIRCFARITIANYDVMARIIDDLLIRKVDRRIAAVLNRASWLMSDDVPISQADLGAMANASRSQVNAALAKFEALGWVSCSYRTIRVLEPAALLRFAQEEAVNGD